jgi:GAF domain-containing protein
VSDRSDENAASVSGQILGLLVQAPDLDARLDRLAHLAAEAVEPAAACGVTIRRDGHPFSVVASNDLAAQVDELQYGTDQGPCLDAMRRGVVIQVDDLRQETRWDSYRPHALAHGVVSSLSVPLFVEGESLGALNLYAATPEAIAGSPRAEAESLAQQCAAALTVSLRQVRQNQAQQQLAEAMVSSSIIDQAIGVLMAQQRCDETTAFGLLRQASQNRNRKLRDIATQIITNVSGKPPQPRPQFRIDPTDDANANQA